MRLLHSAMCCMAVLALCAVFAVMPAAAARPSAVGAHEDRGVINIFSSPDCTVGGPSSSRFTVDRCEPVPLYFNTGYAWMIVRARSDTHATHWQILAFKGGNCNGQGDAAIKPDAFLVGAGNTCTAAGALGSFNFNSVTVTVDPLPAPVATGAISLCADSGCANSIGSVPFTSGACMTIAYWNQNYSSVVFTTSGDSEWLIQAFKGINCNGEYPGEADAIMQGQAGACTQAGDIGTYNLKAFVVTIDPQQQRHRKIDSLKRGAARAAVADPIDSCMPTLTQCISNCRASGQDAWCDWTCRFNYRQCVSKAPPNPAAVLNSAPTSSPLGALAAPIDSCMPTLTQCIAICRADSQDQWCDWGCRFNYRQCVSKAPPKPAAALNSLRATPTPAVDPCLPPRKQCVAKCRAESQDLWCDAGCDADYDMCEAALKYPHVASSSSVTVVPVSGQFSLYQVWNGAPCSAHGPVTSSTPFSSGLCVPTPLYVSQRFSSMIVRADQSGKWMVEVFVGGNCNGGGVPDITLTGADASCTDAGQLASFNANAFAVTVDPVPVPPVTGVVRLCTNTECDDAALWAFEFISGVCTPVELHINTNYTSMITTAAGANDWLIETFHGANCNGDYPQTADAMVQGVNGACTPAGAIGSYNLEALVVTVNSQQRHRKIDSLKLGATPAPAKALRVASSSSSVSVAASVTGGTIRLCRTSCTDFICGEQIGVFSFQAGYCMPTQQYMNTSYETMVVRADDNNQWAIDLYVHAGCNNAQWKGTPDATIAGQGNSCNAAQEIRSDKLETFVVWTNNDAVCGASIYGNPQCDSQVGSRINQFGISSASGECVASLDSAGGSQSLTTDPKANTYVWSKFADQKCQTPAGPAVKGTLGQCNQGVFLYCNSPQPQPKRRSRHIIKRA